MWNEKKRVVMRPWGKFFCFLLFVGVVFLLSGSAQSHAAEQENLEETETKEDQENPEGTGTEEDQENSEEPRTKEELIAEKKEKLADIKDEGKIIIQAKRLSTSKVKLIWEKADKDFIYYVYQKSAKGQKKLLKKVKNGSYIVTGLDKDTKY